MQAKRGCRPRAVPRAGMCARVTVCTANSGDAALVVEFGAQANTRVRVPCDYVAASVVTVVTTRSAKEAAQTVQLPYGRRFDGADSG